ncbi:MAG: hypothetical protein SF051_07035 [Elusimicrobiota bacterium]|nr:hypothetical protein [Elusimicrobiota bacterium]
MDLTPGRQTPPPDFSDLAERAARLRRSALQTRLRLAEQSRELERLSGRLGAARQAAAAPAPRAPAPVSVPGPAPAAAPRPASALPRPVPAPVPKEAVAVSAPVPASLRADARRHAPSLVFAALPFAVIGAAAYAAHAKISPHLRVLEAPAAAVAPAFAAARDPLVSVEPPPPAAEAEEEAEALLLVHDWKPEGAGLTVLQTLGGELDRPGRPPVWSVERVGARQYLVRFRDGAAEHAFEADLETRAVRPAVDADALFAHR